MEPNQNSRIINRPTSAEESEANEQMRAFLAGQAADKFARNNYCVMNRSRTTIVKDPGLDRPFHTPFKKRAEQVAKSVGGVVETLHDALQYIMNNLGSKNKKTGGN